MDSINSPAIVYMPKIPRARSQWDWWQRELVLKLVSQKRTNVLVNLEQDGTVEIDLKTAAFDQVWQHIKDTFCRSFGSLHFRCNWTTNDRLAELFGKMLQESTIRFMNDWTLVCNATDDNSVLQNPENTIVLRMEPNCDTSAGGIFDSWRGNIPIHRFAFWGDHEFHLNTIEWHLPYTLKEIQGNFSSKKDMKGLSSVLSVVCSGLDNMPGHIWRLNFLKHLYQAWRTEGSSFSVHLYGRDGNLGMPEWYRGELPSHNKSEALDRHLYTFACENCEKVNYATEKIWDAILSETICFYRGCPNILDWVDKNSIIVLSDNFEEARTQIETEMAKGPEGYRARLPAIQRTKKELLRRWSLDSKLQNICKIRSQEIQVMVLNLDRRPDRIQKFIQEVQNCGLSSRHPVLRVPATDGVKNGLSTYIDYTNLIRPLREGEIGCIDSHYRVFQMVADSGRPGLVFEDDVRFVNMAGWLDVLYEHFSRLPVGWDYACIGWYKKPQCSTRLLVSHRNDAEWIGLTKLFADKVDESGDDDGFGSFGGGSYAYFISPEGARKILRSRAIFPIDYHLMLLVKLGILKESYATSFPLVYIDHSDGYDTDIQKSLVIY